jgi:hypothetical protein
MQKTLVPIVVLLVVSLQAGRAWALGEETFGNEPLSDANYTDWPGVMPVINTESRVYRIWVNGNEHFYYRGEMAAINDALKQFAALKFDVREVVLRPGSGEAQTFQGNKVPFDWELHLVGGIARSMTTLDKGDLIWRKSPVLSIYVNDASELDKLKIPDGITLLGLADLKKRYTEALNNSTDKTVRGWGCGELAALDAFDRQSMQAILARLEDDDNWVRLNAAGAVSKYGTQAKGALDSLQAAARSDDKSLRTAAESAIASIESATADQTRVQRHAAALKKIEQFLKSQRSPK